MTNTHHPQPHPTTAGTQPELPGPRVRAWDVPVIRALDAIEHLPGFDPDQIEWHSFRFHGSGDAMDTVTVYGQPTDPSHEQPIRFAVDAQGFTATLAIAPANPSETWRRRPLGPDEVAGVLNVPRSSANRAMEALDEALTAALACFNAGQETYVPQPALSAAQRTQPMNACIPNPGTPGDTSRPGVG